MRRFCMLAAMTLGGFGFAMAQIPSKAIALAFYGSWTIFWTLVFFIPESDA